MASLVLAIKHGINTTFVMSEKEVSIQYNSLERMSLVTSIWLSLLLPRCSHYNRSLLAQLTMSLRPPQIDKANFRQSRAAWGTLGAPGNHPYGQSNNSQTSLELKKLRMLTLQVPGQLRRQQRRALIHASARTQAHGRLFYQHRDMPPLPGTPIGGPKGPQSLEDEGVGNILDRISKELSTASASEIDEFNKVLQKEQLVVSKQIKDRINENQKQILQLTTDLKDIRTELSQLRIHRKDLWDVLTDFREAAARRLEIESELAKGNQLQLPGSRGGNANLLVAKRKDRLSVLVLEKMWALELQLMFKHVEGANKFVEAIPGRHVLAELGRWHEVNAGTWKPVKPVHMFILNDLVMMATKKLGVGHKESTSSKKLVATHCWPLAEVEFSQISPPEGRQESKVYFINLKHKQLSFVYQTDRLDHFIKINDALNKARDDHAQSQRRARDDSDQANQSNDAREEKRQLRQLVRVSSMFDADQVAQSLQMTGRMVAPQTKADGLLQNISARVHQRNRSADFKRGPQAGVGANRYGAPFPGRSNMFTDLKQLEDRLDDVDVEIAHNNYPEAVGLICHIRERLYQMEDHNHATENNEEVKLLIEVARLKVDLRQQKVVQGLIFDLQNNIASMGEDDIEQIILFFDTFDELRKGVMYYLTAMLNHLNMIIQRLTVEVQGLTKVDVVNYLSNLVVIHVQIIKRVILVYNHKILPILNADPDSQVDSSGLVNWCIEEMQKLQTSVKKYLLGSLIEVSGHNPDTDHPEYAVKDVPLFQEFLAVLQPQLQELKDSGVNADFKFEDILALEDYEVPLAPRPRTKTPENQG